MKTVSEGRRALLCLINAARRARGIGIMRNEPSLRYAAYSYSRDLVVDQFFSHRTPSGLRLSDRLRDANYIDDARRWWVAENLAWGTGKAGTPVDTVRRWLASPRHRKRMLDPAYEDVGIGVWAGAPRPVSGREPSATYVAEFGVRK